MRRPVRRAELLRPKPGERLHLVASGEKRELGRIGRANLRKARCEQIERFVPFDLDEIAGTAFASRSASQRLR